MIQTGIGPIAVQRQKVRDRASDVPAEQKIRFSSNILPRWTRRSRSLVSAASKKWCRLNGKNQLPRVINGIKFSDGIAQPNASKNRAA